MNRTTKDQNTGQFTASAVACGRRHCTSPHHQGQQWLPVSFFHIAEWADDERTIPKRYQAHCKTCQVLNDRERNGYSARQPSKTGYRLETAEDRRVYNAYQKQRYRDMTDQQREDRRERERIRAEALRRKAGIKPRKLKRLESRLSDVRPQPGEPLLLARPVVEFLEEMVHRHGRTAVANGSRIGTDRLDELMDGKVEHIYLELADRILTGLGYPEQLAVLYPDD